MTDIFTPPQPFEPDTTQTVSDPNNGKTPRRKRKVVTPPAAPASAPKKRGRPAKSDSRPQSQTPAASTPEAEQLDVSRLMGAVVGLDESESAFVASVIRSLQGNNKKSRAKIAASLGKIFG